MQIGTASAQAAKPLLMAAAASKQAAVGSCLAKAATSDGQDAPSFDLEAANQRIKSEDGQKAADSASEVDEAPPPSTPEPVPPFLASLHKESDVQRSVGPYGAAGAGVCAASGTDAAQERQLARCRLLLRRNQAKDALTILNSTSNLTADGFCMKGRCLAMLGDHAGGFASFMAVLAQQPKHVGALMACAALHQACGLLAEAAESLQQAKEAATEEYDDVCEALAAVLTDTGTVLQSRQDMVGACKKYEEAISTFPRCAAAHYSMGVLKFAQGDGQAALECYGEAVRLHPRYAEAHCNMGVVHRQAGRLDDALAAYERAMSIAPCHELIRGNLAVAYNDKGNQLKAVGGSEGALQMYEKALALKPQLAEALYSMACHCLEAGQCERASFFFESALAHAPRCAEAWNNLGVVQRQLRNLQRASQCYAAALQLRPSFPEALNNQAVIYTAQGRANDALQLLQAALVASPAYAEAWNTLGVVQRDLGQMQDAIASYKRCMELQPTQRNAFQNHLLALNSVVPGERSEICSAHADWGKAFQQHIEASWPELAMRGHEQHDRQPDRPLTVGYVSADLCTHSVSYFAEAPLTHHCHSRVRCIVYACVPRPDSKTARLQEAVRAAGGTWRDVVALPEDAIAEQVRRDRVDILVELAGHTANNCLGLMAMRPAPVQVTWIGYPNSTGLPSVNYRLTDAVCDPPATTQTFTERLIRLPGCFLAYTPPQALPPVGPLPALTNGFVTFGSFNALAKITPDVARLWADILRRTPQSRLLLKNKPFACAATRAAYLCWLGEAGIDAERVDLLPLTAETRDHLVIYNDVDMSLDPFPYTGTTTTAESLVMGVPVVTCTGACHAHNVSSSLMRAVGLPGSGWVVESRAGYADAAVAAAHDLENLQQLRSGLRERMLGSSLCRSAAFTSELEDVYRNMWHAWLAGKVL